MLYLGDKKQKEQVWLKSITTHQKLCVPLTGWGSVCLISEALWAHGVVMKLKSQTMLL